MASSARRIPAPRAALVASPAFAAAAPVSAPGASRPAAPAAFPNYAIPTGRSAPADGGEPTVGYDPKRDAILYGTTTNPPTVTRVNVRHAHGRVSLHQANV